MPTRRFLSLTIAVLALGGLAYGGQASFSSVHQDTYRVRPGDSLWSISEAYRVSLQQLAAVNGMQLSDILLIGRTLVIPVAARPAAASRPASSSSSSSGSGGSSSSSSESGGSGSGGSGSGGSGSGSATPALPATVPAAIACAPPQWTGPRGVLPWMSAAEAKLRPEFVAWGDTYGVTPALLEAIAWEESGWQAGVVSSAGAVGIGQLIPATVAFVSQELIGERLNVRSADDNIRMMARFVAYLEGQEGGNLCFTIAAYYEGPTNLADHGIFSISVPYIDNVEALLPRFE